MSCDDGVSFVSLWRGVGGRVGGFGEVGRLEGGEGELAGPFITSAILNEMTRGRMDTEYIHTRTQNHTSVRWLTQFIPHVHHAAPPRSPPPHAITGKEEEEEDTDD